MRSDDKKVMARIINNLKMSQQVNRAVGQLEIGTAHLHGKLVIAGSLVDRANYRFKHLTSHHTKRDKIKEKANG